MSDTHSIYILTIKCNTTMVVIGPKCIQCTMFIPNHPPTNVSVGDTISIKSDGGTSRCRCPEASSFGSCGQFESCWTPLSGISHVQVGHPHPPLNISISTAVCVWSAVDKGWTAGPTGNPEVARQTTGIEFSYLLARAGWVLVSTCM